MASPEPGEVEHDPDEPVDRAEVPRPKRSGRPAGWKRTTSRWWPRARVGLALAEIVAEARGNDALAGGARAIALLGDAVLRTGKDS